MTVLVWCRYVLIYLGPGPQVGVARVRVFTCRVGCACIDTPVFFRAALVVAFLPPLCSDEECADGTEWYKRVEEGYFTHCKQRILLVLREQELAKDRVARREEGREERGLHNHTRARLSSAVKACQSTGTQALERRTRM